MAIHRGSVRDHLFGRLDMRDKGRLESPKRTLWVTKLSDFSDLFCYESICRRHSKLDIWKHTDS